MEDMGIGYNLAILFHIIGILLLFAALTLQWQVLATLRRAKTKADLTDTGKFVHRLSPLFGLAGGVILLSGIYLSYLHISDGGAWGWLVVAIAVFVAMGVYGAVHGRRLEAKVAAAAKGSGQLEAGLVSPASLALSGAMFLSLLILMIFQPSLLNSIIVVLLCLAAGAVGRKNPAA